jgi:hypothetical protein
MVHKAWHQIQSRIGRRHVERLRFIAHPFRRRANIAQP